MKTLSSERRELIEAIVAEGSHVDISAGLLEKDEHLSDALAEIFKLRIDEMQIVFCGGSSLSKAHELIERMSEDADLKVVLSPKLMQGSRNQVREKLSDLKTQISNVLTETGLVQNLSVARAMNENRYFSSQWDYQAVYPSAIGLRPHLQVEFTTRTPVLPIVRLPILRLADRLSGRASKDVQDIQIVAMAETISEKVLSFLRRFAQFRSGQMRQQWDEALVRHIYDTHCAYQKDSSIIVDAARAFPQLLATDQREFGRQFIDFSKRPKSILSDALKEIENDSKTENEYSSHLLPLIYGSVRPKFVDAFGSFQIVAQKMLSTI